MFLLLAFSHFLVLALVGIHDDALVNLLVSLRGDEVQVQLPSLQSL